jgi:hypothetical protein
VRLEGDLLNIRAPSSFHMAVGERCAVRPLRGQVHLFDHESGNALAMPAEGGAAGAGHAAAAGI